MVERKVLIIMGSSSDMDRVKPAEVVLDKFHVPSRIVVSSAHRNPEQTADLALAAKDNDFGVIICAAGMAAHLAGAVAARTTLPVIGVPLSGGALGGIDALYSTVQMPKGIPVATVAIDGTINAAILALQILALSNDGLSAELEEFKANGCLL
ncbi:MAG: 5-(carboxyamino)imidazole ribonucleotide mutase [Candidatus Saccharimonadia bacterium]